MYLYTMLVWVRELLVHSFYEFYHQKLIKTQAGFLAILYYKYVFIV